MIKLIKQLPHHFVTAGKGLFRHLAMTISSASAVMVTLILISLFMILAGNVDNFAMNVESSLKIHATIDKIKTKEEITTMEETIKKMDGIASVSFSSKEEELNTLIDESGSIFERYQDHNPMSDAFIIEVKQASDIPKITQALNDTEGIEKAQYGGESINNMIKTFEAVRTGGTIFVAVLGLLAIFLISNTIKMTIYTRNTEISIMRSVGATNGYIKTPFMIEGMFIGMLGAILPVILTCVGYAFLYQSMDGQFLSNMFILQKPIPFIIMISGVLFISGAVVGFIGSFLATTRYLRWHR